MSHLGARSRTSCLDGLTQEVHSFTWVKDGVSLPSFLPAAEPWLSPVHSVHCRVAERRFCTSSCPCQCATQGSWLKHSQVFQQKVLTQSLLPTSCLRNAPYQVEEVIQPSSKILFFYLPNPGDLVRSMSCSVINTFSCRVAQGKGDTEPLGQKPKQLTTHPGLCSWRIYSDVEVKVGVEHEVT